MNFASLLTIILAGVPTLTCLSRNSVAATPLVRCEPSSREGVAAQRKKPLVLIPSEGAAAAKGIPVGSSYFVALSGNDGWSGRLSEPTADKSDGPFATIERARDAVRADGERRPAKQGGTIYLRNGRYTITQPVVFTSQDAGTRILAFPGEHPRLIGAVSVQASKDDASGYFIAQLPRDPGREIFVGGVRQTQAFKPSPNRDGWYRAGSPIATNTFSFQPGDIADTDGNPPLKVEIFNEGRWLDVFTHITALDSSRHIATVAPSDHGPVSSFGSFRLLGNPAWISRQGQFGWNDAAHRLVINPAAPASLVQPELSMPIVRNLIVFRETSDNAVVGLGFDDTGSAIEGERDSAAIVLDHAHNVLLSANDFRNVGQAVRLIGSSRNIVKDNIVRETGSNGIELQDQSDGNLISDNTLTGIGRVEKSAVAIYLHGASSNRILRNFVSNTSRFGIGIDNWDDQTINIANIVEYNRLFRTNRDTTDTGAIEMLGRSAVDTMSVIRYNDIEEAGVLPSERGDDWPKAMAESGIYLDDLTSGILVCGNHIRGAPLAAIHIHGGSQVEVRDNVAILDRPGASFVFLQGAPPHSGGRRFDFTWHPTPQAIRVATGRAEVRFDNDTVINQEDRDLFVSRITIGSRTLSATDPNAHYAVDDRGVLPGQVALPWNGALVWELPNDIAGAESLPVSVFAWGNPAGGVGAHFTVTIDGEKIGEGIAGSPPEEMQNNKILRNIVYATAAGKYYYKSQEGGAPLIKANAYFDSTGERRLDASTVTDTAPIEADPKFIDPAKGDFRLSPSSRLLAKKLGRPPISPSQFH